MDIAILSGFAPTVMQLLFSRATKGVIYVLEKIQNVNKSLENLNSTVEKAHNMSNSENIFLLDGPIQAKLLSKFEEIASACYDVEDIIDDIKLNIHNRKSDSSTMSLTAVIHHPKLCHKLLHNIEKLQKELDSLLADAQNFLDTSEAKPKTRLSSCVDGQKMSMFFVGREVDIEDIVRRLISNHDVEIKGVSILGMDGLGKTELALAILEDERISMWFSIKLQVNLLDGSFDLKKAIDLLDKRLDKNGFIKEQIQNVLIVIDNLLHISNNDWDKLCDHIKSIGKINTTFKILITTLNPKVPEITHTFAYYLKPLSNENCKKLIENKALSHNQILSKGYLSHVANTLAKQCEGLPIVARILGILLSMDSREKRDMPLIEDVWDLLDFQNEIFPILRSSYLNLSPQLMQCVTYLSLFPDGYQFNIHKLVPLWAGEGFLQQLQGTLTFDKIGIHYFNCLRGTSILQECNDANRNGDKVYELHKFIRKFFQIAPSKIFVRFEKDMRSSNVCINKARHLSLLCDDMENSTRAKLQKMKQLRTFLVLHRMTIGDLPKNLFKTLKRLRVLALNETNITELPDYICSLNFLRFLDISSTPLEKLPLKFFKLSLLEFLHLQNTIKLEFLPPRFCDLTNLVFLDWKMSDIRRFKVPSHIRNLSKLQTLPLFIVDDKEGYRIEELEDLNQLRGSLHIANLEKVKDKAEAEKAMLLKKKYLKRIDLEWTKESRNQSVAAVVEVLEGLKPDHFLNELRIINYNGHMFPEWIFNSSQMFEKIHLENCKNCKVLPALGELRNLKNLIIESFPDLETIDHNFYGLHDQSNDANDVRFPELECLSFKTLLKVSEWTNLNENDFPRLRILKVEDCSRLSRLPSFKNLTSLVELEIERCPTISSLPELPASIESIKIRNCSLLNNRCVVGGEDWHKIDCVKTVEIDNRIIPTSARLPAPPYQHSYTRILFQGYRTVRNNAGVLISRLVLRN